MGYRKIFIFCLVFSSFTGSLVSLARGDNEYEYSETSFDFEDISTTGTNLYLGDDTCAGVFTPFVFSFYGQDHNEIYVGSNGVIYFDNDYIGIKNSCIPSQTDYTVTAFIAPFWDDLDPSAGGAVYYETKGNKPDRRFIVQWNQVPMNGQSGTVTFQVVLFESTNGILFQYQDVQTGNGASDSGASATIGLQKDTALGIEYSCNRATLANGTSILFEAKSQDTDLDGLPDWWEKTYFGNLSGNGMGDNDDDALTNIEEYRNGTDPTDDDTDGDGMPDGWEVRYQLYPLLADAYDDLDGDGRTNLAEYLSGTLPDDPCSYAVSRATPWILLLLVE